jgi:hypothetical protein
MAKKQRSGLAAKLGDEARRRWDEKKAEAAAFGAGGDLPAGIEGGIAQLVECKFSQYEKGDNEGEYFFYAAGIVLEPQEVGNVRVAGLRTSIMEPMCDTPTRKRATVADHLEWVQNELKKLGIDCNEVDVDDVEQVAQAVKKARPYFRFRTWKGSPQTTGPYAGQEPRVQHEWRGVCDYDAASGEASGVDDQTAEEPADEPELPKKEEPKKPAKTTAGPSQSLKALGQVADGGNESAQAKIADKAKDAGIDPEEFATWAEVVEAIEAKASEPEETAEEEDAEGDDDWSPEKGEVYLYKTKGAKKPAECEITQVFPGKRLVNVKMLDDDKALKAVPWDDLIRD